MWQFAPSRLTVVVVLAEVVLAEGLLPIAFFGTSTIEFSGAGS